MLVFLLLKFGCLTLEANVKVICSSDISSVVKIISYAAFQYFSMA